MLNLPDRNSLSVSLWRLRVRNCSFVNTWHELSENSSCGSNQTGLTTSISTHCCFHACHYTMLSVSWHPLRGWDVFCLQIHAYIGQALAFPFEDSSLLLCNSRSTRRTACKPLAAPVIKFLIAQVKAAPTLCWPHRLPPCSKSEKTIVGLRWDL